MNNDFFFFFILFFHRTIVFFMGFSFSNSKLERFCMSQFDAPVIFFGGLSLNLFSHK